MKEETKYYLIIIVVSFFVGVGIQGLVSLLSWTAYPIKAYLFSGVFWAIIWPFVQIGLDKANKKRQEKK